MYIKFQLINLKNCLDEYFYTFVKKKYLDMGDSYFKIIIKLKQMKYKVSGSKEETEVAGFFVFSK